MPADELSLEERVALLEQSTSRDPPPLPRRRVPLFPTYPGGPEIMVEAQPETLGDRILRHQPTGPDNLEGLDPASLDDLVRQAHRERAEPSIAAVAPPGTIERGTVRGQAIDMETGKVVERRLTDRERQDRRLIDGMTPVEPSR
jgi:hypothetical protein